MAIEPIAVTNRPNRLDTEARERTMKYHIHKSWHYLLIVALVSWNSISFSHIHSDSKPFYKITDNDCHDISERNLASFDFSHCTSSIIAILPPQDALTQLSSVVHYDEINDDYQFDTYIRKKKPPRFPFTQINKLTQHKLKWRTELVGFHPPPLSQYFYAADQFLFKSRFT